MAALWTSDDAARATGGQATAGWVASGVSIDTRSLQPGDLFVALKDVRDGHDFVAQALQKGAAAALVSRIPDNVPAGAPLLLVDDVLGALAALGRAARARSRARVIGVTGSAGKTSTKEMLRHVLAGQGRVHAAEKSYNNHWGVPLTLARMPEDATFAVIEIGMNHPGEISPLAAMARPDIAVVTTVVEAHLAAFASLGDIAREKAEIFTGLAPQGIAILRGDLDVSPILQKVAGQHAAQVLTFGSGARVSLSLETVQLENGITRAVARVNGKDLHYSLGAAGRHFAENALAVIATVQALQGDVARAVTALADWVPPSGRGARETVALPNGACDLIDDAFNANPASMRAAFEVLAATAPAGGGQRVAILGDMLELGPNEAQMHAALAAAPGFERIGQVHCVGPRMRSLYDVLPPEQRGIWAETAAELAAQPDQLVSPGHVILVKGSKGSRVSLVVDALRKLGQAAPNNENG